MMKKILLISILIVLWGCATHYDERLLGSWRSDREGTVAEYDRRFPDRFIGKPEKKEKFSKIFGNMTHTFTTNDLTVEYDDSVFSVRYKILKTGNDFILIKTYGDVSEEIRIRFSDNFSSYWVNEDSDHPEKFTKITTEPGVYH